MRQVLLAASLGLIITLFGTPVAIRALVRYAGAAGAGRAPPGEAVSSTNGAWLD